MNKHIERLQREVENLKWHLDTNSSFLKENEKNTLKIRISDREEEIRVFSERMTNVLKNPINI